MGATLISTPGHRLTDRVPPLLLPGDPDLRRFHRIIVHTSAGKDSTALLEVVVTLAHYAGVLDRVVVAHADLGVMDWKGTSALAALHAEAYQLRFEQRRRKGGNLLEAVQERGKWPGPTTRWCTSGFKRDTLAPLITQLADEARAAGQVKEGAAQILNVMGMRAQESTSRARRPRLALDRRASSGRRHVWTWLPLLHFPVEAVWEVVHATGLPYHWVYDHGLSRASCSLCPLAAKADLTRAILMRPQHAQAHAVVEADIGHRFRADLSIEDLIEQVSRGDIDERHPRPTRGGRQGAHASRTISKYLYN
ncbi:hypothetical protein GCM10010411_76800 [Actinomadura fulvescens]|uniref:Phosphoadenosine phosphosulphate reductase domain-containing protein n=1 Tax=Actinomadura fulvescens TaxID=46160 RepID=A0ABN3QJL4_9ACTN